MPPPFKLLVMLSLPLLLTACGSSTNPAPPTSPAPAASQNSTDTVGPTWITRNLIQDHAGDIWIASFTGVYRYDGQQYELLTEHLNRTGINPRTGLTVRDTTRFFDLLQDRHGDYWFTTVGQGVYHYDGTNWRQFTTNEGLASDRVGPVYEDTDGTIWVGTTAGLNRFDSTHFTKLPVGDTAVDNDINDIARDGLGRLWVATRRGLYLLADGVFSEVTAPGGRAFTNTRSLYLDDAGALWAGGSTGCWRWQSGSWERVLPNFTGYVFPGPDGAVYATYELAPGEWGVGEVAGAEQVSGSGGGSPIRPTPDGMLFGGLVTDEEVWVGGLQGVVRVPLE